MSDWKLIATNPVPRDGTWFAICRAGEDDSIEAGCFDQLTGTRYVAVGDGLYRKTEEPIFDWKGFDNFHRATHWCSLQPVPPEMAIR